LKALNKLAAKVDWRPSENLPRVVDALRSARRILLTMHRGPDGDALGSALALGCALREMGREVVVYNPDELPYNFRFLCGASQVATSLPPDAAFDVTVSTDAGSFERLPPDVPKGSARGIFLNLDHHMTTEPFGDINYVDPEAASVGILAYKIIRALNHPISRDAAECIYASILADTGCFRYSSTDPECMRIAAELIEAGVEPWEMTVRVYEMQPLARMKLLAEVLNTLEVHGKLATITITQEMLDRAGRHMELTDGFINYARSIDGIEVAASFSEPEEGGAWRVSFRSRGRVNVAAIAQQFGGGGHHNAAGCSIDGEERIVRARIAEEIEKALNVV
jgi:phosphoesterase RecJ-like protein